MHTISLNDGSAVQVDDFTMAYIEAALWSTNDESDPETGGEPLDKNYGPEDFAPETMAKMVEDCKAFQEKNGHLITDENYESRLGEYTVDEMAGQDFWFTRCGHGCGFWDGDWEKDVGEKLTEASKGFGEVWLEVGDDGQIHGM